jgi:hypothetical protein
MRLNFASTYMYKLRFFFCFLVHSIILVISPKWPHICSLKHRTLLAKKFAPKLRDMCRNVVKFYPEKFSLNNKFSDLLLENWDFVTKYSFLFLRLKFC